jgi:hypothetical protein
VASGSHDYGGSDSTLCGSFVITSNGFARGDDGLWGADVATGRAIWPNVFRESNSIDAILEAARRGMVEFRQSTAARLDVSAS